MCCPSVPAAGDSTSDSTWRAKLLESYAALNTKHTAAKSWLRASMRKPWMTRLFGRIYEPSMVARGVESWIASLAATHASRSVPPESVLAKTILDTYGPTCIESLAKLNRACVFSRTSQATLISDSIPFSLIYERWATELRRACLRRRKSVQAISESDSSSWPTARSSRGGYTRDQGNPEAARPTLQGLAELWATPKASELERGICPSQMARRTPGLQVEAELWTTPQAHDTVQGDGKRVGRYGTKHGGANLNDDVQMWQTPITPDSPKTRKQVGASERENLLPAQAENWPTPTSRDHKGSLDPENRTDRISRGILLDKAAEKWQTPTTPRPHDSENTAGADIQSQKQFDLTRQSCQFSPQDPETSKAGGESSKSTRRLNPRFVEWLMGWPFGWADSECSATALSHYKRRMRSCLYGLVCMGVNQ